MEGWKIKNIEELSKTTSGGTPSRKNKEYYCGDILWVKSGELEDNYIINTEEKITQDAVKNSSAKLFPKGTILMAMYGATVGKTAILNKEATTNQAVCGIFPNNDSFNNEFLRYQLIFKREDFLKQRYGGAQPNISQTIIRNFEVAIPPLPEQRKIAHVLSTVQKAIEQQDKLIRITTELKNALMQKLFTEGIKGEPQKETEIGLVPESWEVVKFPNFVLLQRGKDLTKKNFIDGDIPVAGSNGVIGYHNQSFVKAPGITVGRSGSCGIVNYYEKDFWAHNTSLYVKDFNGNDEMFCFYYLQFLDIGKFKTGVSVPTLDRNSLNTFEVSVPKKEEEKEIAKYIQAIESKIESGKKKKQTLTSLFKTLLHELMTGQRRVHELEFE
jgi:type I restriction enzyme S subunit